MRKHFLAFFLLVTVAFESQVSGAPLNYPLKPLQVACSERQLARTQRRIIAYGSPSIVGSNDGHASPLGYGRVALWPASQAGGVFSGLARIVDLGQGAWNDFLSGQEHFGEEDLAFDLLFKQAIGRLDPRQPRLPEATLVRRNSGTNLNVDHPGCYPMDFNHGDLTCPAILLLDLSTIPADSTHPQRAIVINSAVAPAPGLSDLGSQPFPVATGTSEGILTDRLTEACGGVLTDFDQKVFEILARTLVPSICYWLPFGAPCDRLGDFFGYNMTIFRGADPHVYRVGIYEYTNALCLDNGDCPFGNVGPIALEFRMEWDSRGHLTHGTATVLPQCQRGEDTGCSDHFEGNGIFILPPIFPGHQEQQPAAFQGAPFLTISPYPKNDVLSVRINWASLLKNTGLDSP